MHEDKHQKLPPILTEGVGPTAALTKAYNALRNYVVGSKGAGGIVIHHSAGGMVHRFKPTAVPGGQGGSTNVRPSNELHFNNGVTKIDIDANGFSAKGLGGGNTVTVDSAGNFQFQDNSLNTIVMEDGDIQLVNHATGKTLTISFASITHNMSIQTITVCSAGVTKSMDVIGSAAY